MKTPVIKSLAILATAALLGSCANIQDDQTRTRVEGAGAGAALGALTGGIIGNQSHHAWEGALIGGAVGGAAGLAYGDHVARKKTAYRNEQSWLSACITQAERTNRAAVKYNNQLSDRIDELETEIRGAKARGDTEHLGRLKKHILALQRETHQEIERVDYEIQQQNFAEKKSNDVTLRTNVEKLRSTKSSLKKKETKLADLAKSIDV